MTGLDYLLVYTQSGLPIYIKCYGTFCKTAFKEPEILAGFLSAIKTIPPTLTGGISLQSVKMETTEMRFSKTTPDGHSVVIGLSEEDESLSENVFDSVSKALAADKFRDIDWTMITSEVMGDFERELLNTALPSAFKDHGGFEDRCSLGDMCPIHMNTYRSRKSRIWGAIKDKYAALGAKMSSGS